MDDIAKLRRQLGLSQQATADKASVTRSIISQVEGERRGLSVNAATKAGPVLGIGPGSLYLSTQLAAIKSKVEEEEITEDAAADKLLRVLRTVIEKFEDFGDEEEAEALVDELQALLEDATGKTVSTARGAKPAPTTTKSSAPTFMDDQYRIAGKSIPAEAYLVDDGRDAFGKKVGKNVKLLPEDYGDALDAAHLRDGAEGIFEDPSAYGEANIPGDYGDEEPDVTPRDAFGQARRSTNGGRTRRR